MSVLVLFMLGSNQVQARSIAVEQPEVATALKLKLPNGELAHYRLRISSLTESIRLAPNRKFYIETNRAVPAYLEGKNGTESIFLHFAAVDTQATVSGRVLFDRTVWISSSAGVAKGRFILRTELDLISLGAQHPSITVREAELMSLDGEGLWHNQGLARSAYLALPVAPLLWSMSAAKVGFDLETNTISGTWKLELPLSPGAFATARKAELTLTVYHRGTRGSEQIKIELHSERTAAGIEVWRQHQNSKRVGDFEISWEKTAKDYVGKLSGRLLFRHQSDDISRISIRFGSSVTPYQTQLIGFLARR